MKSTVLIDYPAWCLGGIFISDETRFITTGFAITYSHIFGEQTPGIKIIAAAPSRNYEVNGRMGAGDCAVKTANSDCNSDTS